MSRSPHLGVRGLFLSLLLMLPCVLLGAGGAAAVIHRPARHLAEVPLSLDSPVLPPAALAGQRLDLQLQPTYTGELALTFALDSGPDDMTMDAQTGVLTWTPPAAAEGTEVAVSASVNDGHWTAHTSFTISVAKTRPIATSLSGSTLTVTASGALHGLSLAFPAGAAPEPAQVSLATEQGVALPSLPDGVRRLGDPFTVTPVTTPPDSWVAVSLPAIMVPAGATPQDLCLYAWQGSAEDGIAPRWVEQWHGLDVLPDGGVTLELAATGGLYVLGLLPPVPITAAAVGSQRSVLRTRAGDEMTVSCGRRVFANGTVDGRRWRCQVTGGPDLAVDIRGLESARWNDGVSFEQQRALNVAAYLAASARRLTDLSLGPSGSMAVTVEDLSAWHIAAYADRTQRYRLLHLDGGRARTPEQLKCALANSLFVNAAANTRLDGFDNVLAAGVWSPRLEWIVKGLARWFEDLVYDELDSYRWYLAEPEFPPVLALGLAPYPFRDISWTDPSNRWAFWKLVSSSCSSFNPVSILNVKIASDPSGLLALREHLSVPGVGWWGCDRMLAFAGWEGELQAEFLLKYALATQLRADVASLDDNEPQVLFEGPTTRVWPTPGCSSYEACSPRGRTTVRLRPASVTSFLVGGALLDAGERANLAVSSPASFGVYLASYPWDGVPAPASVVQGSRSFSYGTAPAAGARFVSLVNPSLTQGIEIEVLATISRPVPQSVSLDFEASDPFGACTGWRGHFEARVEAAGADELTARLAQDARYPRELVLDIYGGAAISPAVTITGAYTFEPANNPTEHCPLAGGSYYVYSFSTPAPKGAMYNLSGNKWWPSMGPFALAEPAGWAGDSLEIYWHVTRRRYTAVGDLVETQEWDYPYGYVGIYRRSGTPP
jgi:hypothetical protein